MEEEMEKTNFTYKERERIHTGKFVGTMMGVVNLSGWLIDYVDRKELVRNQNIRDYFSSPEPAEKLTQITSIPDVNNAQDYLIYLYNHASNKNNMGATAEQIAQSTGLSDYLASCPDATFNWGGFTLGCLASICVPLGIYLFYRLRYTAIQKNLNNPKLLDNKFEKEK